MEDSASATENEADDEASLAGGEMPIHLPGVPVTKTVEDESEGSDSEFCGFTPEDVQQQQHRVNQQRYDYLLSFLLSMSLFFSFIALNNMIDKAPI